jgi:hypothetical protein
MTGFLGGLAPLRDTNPENIAKLMEGK